MVYICLVYSPLRFRFARCQQEAELERSAPIITTCPRGWVFVPWLGVGQERSSLGVEQQHRWTGMGGIKSNPTDSVLRGKENVFKEHQALGQNATFL